MVETADIIESAVQHVGELLVERQSELSLLQHRQLISAFGSLCKAFDMCVKPDDAQTTEERKTGVEATLKTLSNL